MLGLVLHALGVELNKTGSSAYKHHSNFGKININMNLYKQKPATITSADESGNSIEGSGYAFTIPDTFQDTIQGVFFAERDHSEALEALKEQSEVTFEGTWYKRTQAGTVRGQKKAYLVKVEKIVNVSQGVRVNFLVESEV